MADQPYVASLIQARDAAARNLAEVLASPKPGYSIAGVSLSWDQYVSMLVDNLDKINRLIQQGGSPFCVVSRGKP